MMSATIEELLLAVFAVSWAPRLSYSLTAAKFQPFIFYVWLHLVLCCEHDHFHDFVWFLLLAWTILSYNRTHTEGWKPCANRLPVWTLENFQRCRELVLQVMQFQGTGVWLKFPGVARISCNRYYWCSMKVINTGSCTLTFELEIWLQYIYCESVGFNHFYVKSQCNSCTKDCTEIVYLIYKGNVPSI
jgi:hypothetical protein